MKKNQVATIEKDNAPLAIVPPAIEFEEFAGAGMETATARDYMIPRVAIIQALSPQLKKSKAEFIADAKEGDICDVGTGDLYRDGIEFLAVAYRKDWIEWAPRSTGKGLVAIHPTNALEASCTRDDKGKLILPNGNLLQETAQFLGLNLSGNKRMCFLPMAASQLKKAKKWMTLASEEKLQRSDGTEFTAPLFYRTYLLTTAEESSAENTWYGWRIQRGRALPTIENYKDLLAHALSFRESIQKGDLKTDVASMDVAEDASASGNEKAM